MVTPKNDRTRKGITCPSTDRARLILLTDVLEHVSDDFALFSELLTRCFAGERHRLVRMAQGAPITPYRQGVSLIALLQRGEGVVAPRQKPDFVAEDAFDPTAERALASV